MNKTKIENFEGANIDSEELLNTPHNGDINENITGIQQPGENGKDNVVNEADDNVQKYLDLEEVGIISEPIKTKRIVRFEKRCRKFRKGLEEFYRNDIEFTRFYREISLHLHNNLADLEYAQILDKEDFSELIYFAYILRCKVEGLPLASKRNIYFKAEKEQINFVINELVDFRNLLSPMNEKTKADLFQLIGLSVIQSVFYEYSPE